MRKTAVITTTIWSDGDFLALTTPAQRIYLLALSQPNLSWAGVVDYTPRRWAHLGQADSPTRVRRAVAELELNAFVVVDESSEELLVRSLIRHDRALRSPNMAKALVRDVERIQSRLIRGAVLAELARHHDETSKDPGYATGWKIAAHLVTEPLSEPFDQPFGKGVA